MHTEDVSNPATRGERVAQAAALHRRRAGFSMTELVTVIAIIGIMATIVVVSFSNVDVNGRDVLAQQRLELLNGALSTMNICGRSINAAANLGSAGDEQLIVMTLQLRDENLVGSPFLIPNYRPQTSSDVADHRLRYNGVRFELISPGQAGVGLKVAFDGSDIGPARVFPPNFQPYGS